MNIKRIREAEVQMYRVIEAAKALGSNQQVLNALNDAQEIVTQACKTAGVTQYEPTPGQAKKAIDELVKLITY